VLQLGPVRRHPVDVCAQTRPAREAVLARDHELRGRQLERLCRARLVRGHPVAGTRITRAVRALKVSGSVAQLLEARRGRERCGGHDSLLS